MFYLAIAVEFGYILGIMGYTRELKIGVANNYLQQIIFEESPPVGVDFGG
jgi:hypothetical protein